MKKKLAKIQWSETNRFEVELEVPEDLKEEDIFEYYYLGRDPDRTWTIDVLGSREVEPNSIKVECQNKDI